MKGRGRGLLAIVFSDRDRPVGRVEPEPRSPTRSSEEESERAFGQQNSPTGKAERKHDRVESSFARTDGTERDDSSTAMVDPTPRGIPRVRPSQQSLDSSTAAASTTRHHNSSPLLPAPSENPVGYKDDRQGYQHGPRFRSRGGNRPQRGHRLNKPGRQEQRKYYQQLDAFLEDHKRDQLQSDVKDMISRNRERTRRQDERVRLSRDALEGERKKDLNLKSGLEEKTGKERGEREKKETGQQDRKATQMDVECLRKQLEDVSRLHHS